MQPELDFTPRKRGAGKGSKFFVLDKREWDRLWSVRTANRMNLQSTYLVLMAGTGADHRLTKWSAKACEQYAGMGKPRAKAAIEELIADGIMQRTSALTARFPQYEFMHRHEEQSQDDVIYMPNQFVTGCSNEVSMLRRIRETGDPMLLRMQVDLHGFVQVDPAFGLPLGILRLFGNQSECCRKVGEFGANTIWALSLGGMRQVDEVWMRKCLRKNSQGDFWSRINVLQQIGAIWFEPWVFDSDRDDAEPLFPVEGASSGAVSDWPTHVRHQSVAGVLVGNSGRVLDPYGKHTLVVLPAHHSPPALRGVCRLRVEPDTPGRRTAYAQRMALKEGWQDACDELYRDLQSGRTDKPIRVIHR